uniref:Uncharacterized protein n=1 Tax=Arundo donax TaxID=35708 RepID=A0A0A9APP3_ARUDO
MYTPASLFGR